MCDLRFKREYLFCQILTKSMLILTCNLLLLNVFLIYWIAKYVILLIYLFLLAWRRSGWLLGCNSLYIITLLKLSLHRIHICLWLLLLKSNLWSWFVSKFRWTWALRLFYHFLLDVNGFLHISSLSNLNFRERAY